MPNIQPGDLVVAIPIDDCTIGHPAWHEGFAHPEMDRKTFMVLWSGFSAYWKRPIVGVAGRRGHFCAGCFAKQSPPEGLADKHREPVLEAIS